MFMLDRAAQVSRLIRVGTNRTLPSPNRTLPPCHGAYIWQTWHVGKLGGWTTPGSAAAGPLWHSTSVAGAPGAPLPITLPPSTVVRSTALGRERVLLGSERARILRVRAR